MSYAVYNPRGMAPEDLPVIYGFNNGPIGRNYHGMLISEDGMPLGEHLCSHEDYMLRDLGIIEGTRPDRHEQFRRHYPEGYRMEFMSAAEMQDTWPVGFRWAMKRSIEAHSNKE